MAKYLVLVLVVLLVVWFVRRGRGSQDRPTRAQPPTGKGRTPQHMLACAHCGMHLPAPEALFDPQERPYCSEAHRAAGPR